MLPEIESKIESAGKALSSIGYTVKEVSPQEFYDFMTGEIFSKDTTALDDVLRNEYLMIHELVEISELKKMGRTISKQVIVNLPKTVIYDVHCTAIERELEYALHKKDLAWVKNRLRQHKESVLEGDPNLPEEIKPRAEAIFKKFRKALPHMTDERLKKSGI